MGVAVGLNHKTYRNTGNFASPVWNEVTPVGDETVNMERGFAEVRARLSTWVQNLVTLKNATIDTSILNDPAIDDFNAFRDAFLNASVLDMAFADGGINTSGVQYLRGDFYAGSFTINKPLEEVSTVDISLALAYSSNVPSWNTVA